jgi:hypothetical protein
VSLLVDFTADTPPFADGRVYPDDYFNYAPVIRRVPDGWDTTRQIADYLFVGLALIYGLLWLFG